MSQHNWYQPEHRDLGCVTTQLIPARTPRFGLCHNTLTPARTPGLGLCHNTLTPARTPRLWLCHNTLTRTRTPRLGLCHNTLTPARTPRLWLCRNTDTNKNTKAWAVSQHTDTSKNTEATLHYCCIGMWRLSSATIRSLHNSIHPPYTETEISPPKMVCGCPRGGVIIERSHMQSSHQMECFCQYTVTYTGWVHVVVVDRFLSSAILRSRADSLRSRVILLLPSFR